MRVILVARNVCRGILAKQALYIWGGAVLLLFLRAAPSFFVQRGDERLMAFLRANAVSGGLDTWSILCIAGAIVLGATAVSGEVSSKRIVTVLARPIRRWEFLVGKWLGVSAFMVLSLAMGLVLVFGIASYFAIDMDGRVLRIALAQTAVSIVLFSGTGIALSITGSSALAVAVTVLLAFLPNLITVLLRDPSPRWHAAGVVLDCVAPAGYENLYPGVAWAPPPGRLNVRGPAPIRTPPPIDYGAQTRTLFTNVAYAGAYFLIGCFFFSRRDMRDT